MLLDDAAFGMMEMAIVQVIDVAIVLDGRVPAARAVLVRMIRMGSRHGLSPWLEVAIIRRESQFVYFKINEIAWWEGVVKEETRCPHGKIARSRSDKQAGGFRRRGDS